MTAEELWKKSGLTESYESWSFGGVPDELAALVKNGEKTATCSAYDLYLAEGKPIPKEGEGRMVFNGISKVFSTKDDRQYETIGAFWDEFSQKYGREKLRGLGYNWTTDTIEYVIGLKSGDIDNANCSVVLPNSGWIAVKGKTAELDMIYQEIYADGVLTYEIETFTDEGECEILYYR